MEYSLLFWELVRNGAASYSIIGVETQNNMDSMQRFLEAVGIHEDNIICDDGTQVILKHPYNDKIVLVIDAGGLGDFFDSGFEVSFVPKAYI